MIAIDTNVLLRYLYREEDPAQADVATRLIERQSAENGGAIWISNIVLCELIWTLRRTYKLTRSDLVSLLRRIVAESNEAPPNKDNNVVVDRRADRFVLENGAVVRQALDDFASGPADFADHLIGRLGKAAGATTTYTFDRAAAGAPTFKRLRGHRG